MGVLSSRGRAAAAAVFACLRKKGCASMAAAQLAEYHALPFSGMDQGKSLPYWELPPNPTRLWLNLNASTPLMF
jgi:hypothetical protein